jgi:hypothetical protein
LHGRTGNHPSRAKHKIQVRWSEAFRLANSPARSPSRFGVGCCVIISTGFAEMDEHGADRQAAIVDLAARSGMRILGPNCMGMIVPHHKMALCSSVVLNTDTLGDGPIGLVSQSGALMVSMFDRAKADGIGLRYGISCGNQSDLEICDFIDHMVQDDETKAICVYVEGFVDPDRFRQSAIACRRVDKPIAGLLKDLKQRGLLEDTVVVWATEFGRTPGGEGSNGRDHHPFGFSIWMAGGGLKRGVVHGATDELGFHAVENRHYVTDVHATVLNLLGLDHRQMEIPGRKRLDLDFGQPIQAIMA